MADTFCETAGRAGLTGTELVAVLLDEFLPFTAAEIGAVLGRKPRGKESAKNTQLAEAALAEARRKISQQEMKMDDEMTADEKAREDLKPSATAEVSVLARLTWRLPPDTNENLARRAEKMTANYLRFAPTNTDGAHIVKASVSAEAGNVEGGTKAPQPRTAHDVQLEMPLPEVANPL